jgi:hypothetical protein
MIDYSPSMFNDLGAFLAKCLVNYDAQMKYFSNNNDTLVTGLIS